MSFSHDQDQCIFKWQCGGQHEAYLQYRLLDDGRADYYSTYVPDECRGGGTGARLVMKALEWAKEQQLEVIPSCWFVAKVMQR